jgi:hypothetical protein
MHAENVRRRFRFRETHVRTGAARRRFAVSQIDNTDSVTLPNQFGHCSTAADFHVVRVGADGNQIDRFG